MSFSRLPRSPLAALVALALVLPVMASAHEGHKNNMSDAEMAQMEMRDAHPVADVAAATADGAPAMVEGERAVEAVNQPPTAEQALDAKIAENRVRSVGDFLGRLHPLAAHFPVALLLMAALAEILLLMRPALGLETTLRFLVAGGAVGAGIAALLGWFAGGWRLDDRSETLGLHRWNGTVIAAVAGIAAWLAFRSAGRTRLRIALALLAAGILFQGYLGGEMVFGPNHLGLE